MGFPGGVPGRSMAERSMELLGDSQGEGEDGLLGIKTCRCISSVLYMPLCITANLIVLSTLTVLRTVSGLGLRRYLSPSVAGMWYANVTRRPIILGTILIPTLHQAVLDTVVIIIAFSETRFGSEFRQRPGCLHNSARMLESNNAYNGKEELGLDIPIQW
jgi:hypothetical protein